MSKFNFDNWDYAPPDEAFVELLAVVEDAEYGLTNIEFRASGTRWTAGEFTVRLVGGVKTDTDKDDWSWHDAEYLFDTLEANNFEVIDRMDGMETKDNQQLVVVEATVRWWPDGIPQMD